MEPGLRKLALTVHVTCSVGWLGALAAFLALSLASVISDDAETVRSASIGMALTAWFVILPLAMVALASGLVQALGTPWGLFRHYWILTKLLLTVLAAAVLLLKLGPISHLAAAPEPMNLVGLRVSLLSHAAGGLVVLLATTVLGLYKPAGTTQEASIPIWVKGFGALLLVLVIAVAIMLIGGGHGPGAHLRGEGGG